MRRIGFVTDSTAYLTPEQKRLFDAEVVSLTVNFGNESFLEEGLYSNFQEFRPPISARWVLLSVHTSDRGLSAFAFIH